MRTWFPIDLLAVYPFELFAMASGGGSVCGGGGEEGGFGSFTGLFKIFRLLRLGRHDVDARRFLPRGSATNRNTARGVHRIMKIMDKLSGADFARIVYYLVGFVLVAHWQACTFFFSDEPGQSPGQSPGR